MEKTITKRGKEPSEVEEDTPTESVIKLIFRGLIPIILLAGGLFLLDLPISVWSVILGLPVTVIGVALLIFTYDEVVSKKIIPSQPRFVVFESKYVKCFVCGKKTPRVPGEWEEDIVCPKCKSLKEGKRVKRKSSSTGKAKRK